MNRITVLVVDDHLVVREGLRSLLSQYHDIVLVGETGDESQVLQLVRELQPDVILLDIRLQTCTGFQIAAKLRRMHAPARLILLTAYDDASYLVEAARAQVHGYLVKDACAETLVETIRAVARGEIRISPAMASKAFEQLEVVSRAWAQSECSLTGEELRLLQLMAEGADTEELAQTLCLSTRTAKRKVQDVLTKLGAVSRVQAVAEGFKRGLL